MQKYIKPSRRAIALALKIPNMSLLESVLLAEAIEESLRINSRSLVQTAEPPNTSTLQ